LGGNQKDIFVLNTDKNNIEVLKRKNFGISTQLKLIEPDVLET